MIGFIFFFIKKNCVLLCLKKMQLMKDEHMARSINYTERVLRYVCHTITKKKNVITIFNYICYSTIWAQIY